MAEKREISPIVICNIGTKYFVWNSDHILQLRTKYKICGVLVGSKPSKVWQTGVHSAPLILSPIEASFCYNNGIANIVDGKKYFSMRKIATESISDFEEKRLEKEKEQIRIFKKCKLEKNKLYYGLHKTHSKRILKSGELVRLDVADEMKCHSESDENCHEGDVTPGERKGFSLQNIDKDDNPLELSKGDLKYYKSSVRVHIYTNSVEESSLVPYLFNYPVTDGEKCRCAVYNDIHQKGFYITSALKFGGDFLVYPGDPLRYHSHFIILVLERNRLLTMKETITYGRLAAAVKKTVVLATVNNDYSSVSYLSLVWAHMK